MKKIIKKILKEDDWDWVRDQNPITKPEISRKVRNLYNFSLYSSEEESDEFTTALHQLALSKEEFDKLFVVISRLSRDSWGYAYDSGLGAGYEDGSRDGYREGYREGYDEAEGEYSEKYNEGWEEGYDEGFMDGKEKGYQEGKEETYYKAFEEGRAYQHELENEDFERGESDFDPSEYDEDYDEDF
jgi:flagellar biosynthesis/type III secretory pathway protein FliH